MFDTYQCHGGSLGVLPLFSSDYSTALSILAFFLFCCRILDVGLHKSHKGHKARPSPSPCPVLELQKKGDVANYGPICAELPYVLPALKSGISSKLTMSLKRLDKTNWLSIHHPMYLHEHKIRSKLLASHKPMVIQCLPGSEAACHEVLNLVSSFLIDRYPEMFYSTSVEHADTLVIHNALTKESFTLGSRNKSPLETAARLAMEDFNVLSKNPLTGEYHLVASATLFPAGWKLEERINWTLDELHGVVPGWAAKLGCPVNRYLDHLSAKTAMERHSLFVQRDGRYFHDEDLANYQLEPSPKSTTHDLNSSSLNASLQSSGYISSHPDVQPEIHIRRERQTFVPLPSTTESSGQKTALFTVHTFLTPLADLSDMELDAFIDIVQHWSDETAKYKGRKLWMADVLRARALRGGSRAGG